MAELSVPKLAEVLLPCLEKCDGQQGALFDDSKHRRSCPAYYRESVTKNWQESLRKLREKLEASDES